MSRYRFQGTPVRGRPRKKVPADLQGSSLDEAADVMEPNEEGPEGPSVHKPISNRLRSTSASKTGGSDYLENASPLPQRFTAHSVGNGNLSLRQRIEKIRFLDENYDIGKKAS